MSRSFFFTNLRLPFFFFFATITITFVKYLNGKNYNSKLWCVCYATYLHSYTNDVTLFDCFFFVRLWVLANEHSCLFFFFSFLVFFYDSICWYSNVENVNGAGVCGSLGTRKKTNHTGCTALGVANWILPLLDFEFFCFFLFVFSLTKKKATGWEPPPVVLFFCKLASRPPVTRISNDVIDPLV